MVWCCWAWPITILKACSLAIIEYGPYATFVLRVTPPSYNLAPPSVNPRRDICTSTSGVNFMSVLQEELGQCEGSTISAVLGKSLSSLNSSSISSVERQPPLFCALNQHSTSLNPSRVRYYLCLYSPLISILDVFNTIVELLMELYLYSPSILPMDVYNDMLGILLGLWLYSPLILIVDVYDTTWGSFQMTRLYRCSAHLCSSICSLLPCSLWPSPNLNLPSLEQKYHLCLNCRFVLVWMIQFRIVVIRLDPISSSNALWLVYRYFGVVWPAIGVKDINTYDSIYVFSNGSTLFSVAYFKIVKPVLGADAIRDASPLVVCLTIIGVFLPPRLKVVETLGHLYDFVCSCVRTLSILCYALMFFMFVPLRIEDVSSLFGLSKV